MRSPVGSSPADPLASTTVAPLPRLRDTPLHAHAPGTRLVSSPVPLLDAVAWPAQRESLLEAGALHLQEAMLADAVPPASRATFVSGRVTMRRALAELRQQSLHEVPAVARSARGAPLLPEGIAGSITHKRDVALAAVAPCADGLRHLGVDLEHRPVARDLERPSIASRVLTVAELSRLHDDFDDELARRERTLLLFSLKEAVYKAIDPFVGRYVRFTEVEVDVHATGTAAISLRLPELQGDDVRVAGQWYVDGPWIVTSAFAYR
jgi:enterobactin synthetase component D